MKKTKHYRMKSKKTGKKLGKKSSKKTRKSSKLNIKARGPEDINCCMCDHSVNKKNTFVPLACLQKHGAKAHRICHNCWWDPETGFARENAPHGCPGCKRGVPLNPSPSPHKKGKSPKSDEIIVISD